jgi:hypothetical protein
MVSHVSTPREIGTPMERLRSARALQTASLIHRSWEVSPLMTQPSATYASGIGSSRSCMAIMVEGNSQVPGHLTTVRSPEPANVSVAPEMRTFIMSSYHSDAATPMRSGWSCCRDGAVTYLMSEEEGVSGSPQRTAEGAIVPRRSHGYVGSVELA